MNDEKSLSAFCHIIKASGTTVTSLLRRNHGVFHLDTRPAKGKEEYELSDLERDMRLFPRIRSLSGHGLRPYLNYGKYSDRMVWFTWLRNPVDRLISGYQHGVEKGGIRESFEEWLTQPNHRNRLIFTLTGTEDDLEKAKDILKNEIRFFGLLERFDESALLLRHKMGWTNFNIDYPHPKNTAHKNEFSRNLKRNIERYRALIDENTAIDQEFYDWATSFFPRQIQSYGATSLKKDLFSAFPRAQIPLRERINEGLNDFVRKLIYKPFIHMKS